MVFTVYKDLYGETAEVFFSAQYKYIRFYVIIFSS